jgi:hypothetical protein
VHPGAPRQDRAAVHRIVPELALRMRGWIAAQRLGVEPGRLPQRVPVELAPLDASLRFTVLLPDRATIERDPLSGEQRRDHVAPARPLLDELPLERPRLEAIGLLERRPLQLDQRPLFPRPCLETAHGDESPGSRRVAMPSQPEAATERAQRGDGARRRENALEVLRVLRVQTARDLNLDENQPVANRDIARSQRPPLEHQYVVGAVSDRCCVDGSVSRELLERAVGEGPGLVPRTQERRNLDEDVDPLLDRPVAQVVEAPPPATWIVLARRRAAPRTVRAAPGHVRVIRILEPPALGIRLAHRRRLRCGSQRGHDE